MVNLVDVIKFRIVSELCFNFCRVAGNAISIDRFITIEPQKVCTHLDNIFRHHGVHFHCYANDTQLCMSVKPTASLSPPCLHDINLRMTKNYLKLKSKKTKLLILGTKSALAKINTFTLSIDDFTIYR